MLQLLLLLLLRVNRTDTGCALSKQVAFLVSLMFVCVSSLVLSDGHCDVSLWHGFVSIITKCVLGVPCCIRKSAIATSISILKRAFLGN